MSGGLAVACLDVGAPGNLGWAILGEHSEVHGSDPREFVSQLVTMLKSQRVALGFECPLYVPLREDPSALTQKRSGEHGVYWSGGPGGGVLAAGIVQARWVLSELVRRSPKLKGTTRWIEFVGGVCSLFVWEAFIASSLNLAESPTLAKFPLSAGRSHERDALAGALTARRHFWGSVSPQSAFSETRGISLIGMHLLATGLSSDRSLLDEACLVICVRKPE